jgi:hypothetical protein
MTNETNLRAALPELPEPYSRDEYGNVIWSSDDMKAYARKALATPTAASAQEVDSDDLYARLELLSQILESSGRIDEHEYPGAYAAVLDAMRFVATPTAAVPAYPPLVSPGEGYELVWAKGITALEMALRESDKNGALPFELEDELAGFDYVGIETVPTAGVFEAMGLPSVPEFPTPQPAPAAPTEPCKDCGQRDIGQYGEYPCKTCGLPKTWGNDPQPSPAAQGFRLVPETPTDGMVDAFEDNMEAVGQCIRNFRAAYRAMLAASPQAAAQGAEPVAGPTEEQIATAWREALGKVDHATLRRIYAIFATPPAQAGDRDALITQLASALNVMLMFFGMDEDENSKQVFDEARVAHRAS